MTLKADSSAPPNPSTGQPPSPSVAELIGHVRAVFTAASDCLIRHLEEQASRATEAETHLAGASGKLEQIQASLGTLQSTLPLEVARLLETVRSLSQRQETFDHNLDQSRRLAENLDRKLERLSGDFIDRRVTEPLFKHLVGLWHSLQSLGHSPSAPSAEDILTLADEIERLLDTHGLVVVLPKEGQPLDPHAHQPIQTCPTDNPALHGCIAQSFQPGLRNAQRVMQPARVAVFTCTQLQPKDTV